jgi:hypothetical protein
MWAQVIKLADLTTGDGKNLISECRDKNFRSSVHHSIQWPTAGRPNYTCWKEWQQALDTCFLRPDDQHERLNRPLGPWTKLPNKWQWHFDQEQDILYEYHSHQTRTQWRRNKGRGPTRHQGFRRSAHAVATLPAEALPTTVYGRDIKRPQGTKPILPPTAVSPEKWWYEIIDAPASIQPLLEGIKNGTAIWVTDGSYKETYGTAAFILLPDIDAQEGLIMVNQTPGREDDTDAYRAEAAGTYGCITFTNELMQQHQLANGTVTMACDCLSALWNIFNHQFDKAAQAHYDIIHSCRMLVERSPAEWISRHVRGHQDDHVHYKDLDRWGQLNINMNTLAKRYWQTVYNNNRPHFDLPATTEWSIWHRD